MAKRQPTLAEFVNAKDDDIPALYYVHHGEKMKKAYARKFPMKLDDKLNFSKEYLDAWFELLKYMNVMDKNHDNQQYIKWLLKFGARYERPPG